jgi:hypothetical protein
MAGLIGSSGARGSTIPSKPAPGLVVQPGDLQPTVVVTAPPGTVTLPSVTVPAWAAFSNFTLDKVLAVFKFRKITNGSVSPNQTNGPQFIQVKETTAGSFVNAILLPDLTFNVVAGGEGMGDMVPGVIDVSAQVTGPGTYDFRWLNSLAAYASLTFYDVQMWLLFYFK